MQKQLVLAALFATAHAVTDCTDANVELVRARKKAIVDALAGTTGLTAAKTTATEAKTATDTALTNATTEFDAWTTAMATYTTQNGLSSTSKTDNDTAYTTARASADLLASEGCYTVRAANVAADVVSLITAKQVTDAAAETPARVIVETCGTALKTTSDALKVGVAEAFVTSANAALQVAVPAGVSPVTAAITAAISQSNLTTANANVATLLTNETEHENVRLAKLGLQTTAKNAWDAGLTAITTARNLLTAEKTKRATDANILVANVDQTTAAAVMKGHHANGIGHADGAAYTTGADGAAAFYMAQYVDITATPKGYAVLRAEAVTAQSTTYATYKTAQEALEKQAMIFGKIKYACQDGASFAGQPSPSKQLESCLRTGGFEKAYFDSYIGSKGTAAAFPAIVAVTLVGLAGDVAADGGALPAAYTTDQNIAAYVKGYTVSSAGTAALGTAAGSHLPRDNAYDLWYAKIVDSAATQVTEERALVQHRILLKRAESEWAWTTIDLTSVSTSAPDVIRATTAGDYATYVNASDGFLTTFKIQAAKLGKTYSAPSAKARSGTTAYFKQLSRTINTCYNDVIVKRVALGTGAAASGTQAAMALGAMQTLGGAGLTQAIVTAATGFTKAYLEASLALNVAAADKTQATNDKTRAQLVQTAASAKIKDLQATLAVKNYLFKIQKDAYDGFVIQYKGFAARKTLLDATQTASGLISTKANAKKVFVTAVKTRATAARDAATTAFNNADAAITQNTADKTAIDAEEVRAVADCKARGYKQAQETLKRITAAETTNAATALTVKTAYDALVATSRPAAVAEGSAAGADCAYPAAGADGAVGARPKCAAELCCGAANKYLKNGTKLTIETCQATAATSYTYYPQLRAGATVAPTTEQWRFSCVGGAKNLAATATAALAAAYLMA